MGSILSMLRVGGSDACNLPPQEPITLNLKETIFDPGADSYSTQFSELLKNFDLLLMRFRDYSGCDEAIRAAISNATPENDDMAMAQLDPSVRLLKSVFELSTDIEKAVPPFLDNIIADTDTEQQIIKHSAGCKAFIQIASFVGEFDAIKVTKPSIQNDFSYYKRSMNKRKTLGAVGPSSSENNNLPVNETLANKMSYFYAYPSPMLKAIIDTCTNFVSSKSANKRVGEFFMVVANFCRHASTQDSLAEDQKCMFVRAMTVLLVLYDHVHPTGLFLRPITVPLRAHVEAIQAVDANEKSNMLNSLKYSTKNYTSPNVPSHVRSLFETSFAK